MAILGMFKPKKHKAIVLHGIDMSQTHHKTLKNVAKLEFAGLQVYIKIPLVVISKQEMIKFQDTIIYFYQNTSEIIVITTNFDNFFHRSWKRFIIDLQAVY